MFGTFLKILFSAACLVGGAGLAFLSFMAAAMSDAPSMDPTPVVWLMFGGVAIFLLGLAGCLALIFRKW